MFTLESIIISTCPAVLSASSINYDHSAFISAILSSDTFESLFNILSIMFICVSGYSLETELQDSFAATCPEFNLFLQFLIESDVITMIEDEMPLTVNNKRRFEDDSNDLLPANKMPKLMASEMAMIFQEFLPKGFVFTTNYKFRTPEPIPPNHERITLIEDADDSDSAQVPPQEFEKKPFDWYLRWDLPPMEELEHLTYAEKARRFYHVTTFGEPPEAKEMVEDTELDDVEPQINVGAIAFKVPIIPMNVLSDLISKANTINLPEFQMALFKMNSQLVCAFLQNQKFKFLQERHLKKFDPMSCLKYYQKPKIINLKTPNLLESNLLISVPFDEDIILSKIESPRSRKSSILKDESIIFLLSIKNQ